MRRRSICSEIILVKLGGSLITDKARPDTPRRDVIARLASEIARASSSPDYRLIVGHGSGSFGHAAARRFDLGSGIRSAGQLPGVSLTQQRAAALHALVVDALAAAGALPYSLAPSSCVVAAAGQAVTLLEEPLLLALGQGLLPVLYGDVVTDREWGAAICSTERLFDLVTRRLLAREWVVRRAIWLGDTDGLHDAAGRTVPRVSAANFDQAVLAVGEPRGNDVTGGMRHRLQAALDLARLGIPSLLANGLTPGALERALRGDDVPGTLVF